MHAQKTCVKQGNLDLTYFYMKVPFEGIMPDNLLKILNKKLNIRLKNFSGKRHGGSLLVRKLAES